MNTVTIELETMLENKHGKLLVSKDWHIFTIEAEDPKAFLKLMAMQKLPVKIPRKSLSSITQQ